MSAEKRSISAPESLYAQADARKEELGYATFSDYIQALIRSDVTRGDAHLREVSPVTSSTSEAAVPHHAAKIAVAAAAKISYGAKPQSAPTPKPKAKGNPHLKP